MNVVDVSPAGTRHATWFVLTVVFIDVIGFGLIVPVLPVLVGQYTSSPELQTYWSTALASIYGLMQFLCAPLLGAISDNVGRRPTLLASIIGMGLHYFLIAIAPSLWIILFARFLGGITGASFTVAQAYLADVTPRDERAKAFGRVGAAMGLGLIVGPALGGVLGDIHLHLPFYVAASVAAANAVWGFVMVKESHPPEKRTALSRSRANPFRALLTLARNGAVGSFAAVYGIFFLAHMVVVQTWVLFTHFRFDWGTRENGMLMFTVGLASTVMQGVLLSRLVKRLGEQRLVLTAVAMNVLAMTLFGLAPQGWMMFAIMPVWLLMFAVGPTMQSIVSKATDASAQGITLGALQSIQSLAAVIGPLIGGVILAAVSTLPPSDIRVGATFFFAALLNVVAFAVARRRFRRAPAA